MSLSKELREQLVNLNRPDVEEAFDFLRKRAAMLSALAACQFSTGDKVKWESGKRGMTMHGTVQKVNRTTVIVKVVDGAVWRVASTLLTEDVKGTR